MEAYRIDSFGSVDGIVLRSSEDPRPGLREILMRVRASSPLHPSLTPLWTGQPLAYPAVQITGAAANLPVPGQGREGLESALSGQVENTL